MEHLNALPTGTRLGEYEIEAVLGAGGFGITYRAQDVNLGKIVAIKEYLPRDFAMRTNTRTVVPTSSADQADYEWGLRRFLDEARTLARFNHPHLNKVQRYFEAHGTAYLVLDYVEGETLSAVLQRQGRLREAVVTRLLRDVLSGVEEVHAAGYVHRDLKPGNLMMQPDGSVMVLDFGAARQAVGQRSKSITSILTPGYAPIEQYDTNAEDVGPWSDLYALGMVAYRCISGLEDKQIPDAVTRSRAARKGSGDLEPAVSIGRGRYDAWLLRAIDWAIQVEEDERPQSIAAWRQGMPPLAHSQGHAGPLTSAPVRRRAALTVPRWATVAGVVALVVAVAGGAYWYVQQSGLPVDGLPDAASRQAERPAPQENLESAPPAPAPEPRQTASATPATEEPVPKAAVPESPDHAAMETALGLGREEQILVQQGLAAAGHEPGPADGLFGGETTRTRQAIRAWQAAKGMTETGYVTRAQADTLMALGQEAEAQRAAQAAAEREAQADTLLAKRARRTMRLMPRRSGRIRRRRMRNICGPILQDNTSKRHGTGKRRGGQNSARRRTMRPMRERWRPIPQRRTGNIWWRIRRGGMRRKPESGKRGPAGRWGRRSATHSGPGARDRRWWWCRRARFRWAGLLRYRCTR